MSMLSLDHGIDDALQYRSREVNQDRNMTKNFSQLFSRPDPTGIILGAIGTSLTAGANSWTATSNYSQTLGYLEWVRFLSSGRFYSPDYLNDDGTELHGTNKGIGGAKVSDIVGQARAQAAQNLDICIVEACTNDISNSTFDEITTDLAKAYEILLEAGIFVVALATPAKGSLGNWPVGSTAKKLHYRVNQWKRDYCTATTGMIFINPNGVLVDPADASGYLSSYYTTDGTHFNGLGAYVVGLLITNALNAIWPSIEREGHEADNKWDAIDNPMGNMYPNPNYIGTGGAIQDGSTGLAPDNMKIYRGAGSSISAVSTLEPRTDGSGRWLSLAITIAGTADERLYVAPSPSTVGGSDVTEGGWYQLECDMEVSSSNNALHYCELMLQDKSTGGVKTIAMHGSMGGTIPQNFKGRAVTKPIKLKGTAGLKTYISIGGDGTIGGTSTIKLGSILLRQVPDPATILAVD